MILHVQVTSEHIKNGKKSTLISCPIALAVKQLGYKEVFVTPFGMACIDPSTDSTLRVELPEVARKFIRSFDADQDVTPIEFYLQVP